MQIEKRKLKPKEISVRVGSCTANGVSLLLYVETRAAMSIMDELFGFGMWKREHFSINDETFCRVSVFNNDIKEWICMEDVGTGKRTEKEKTKASDSFKRACVNFGIGRELYSAPFIWIPKTSCKITESKTKDGKTIYKCDSLFYVNRITYNSNDKIESLQIIKTNKSGKEMEVVYVYYPNKRITKDKLRTLENIFHNLGKNREREVLEMCSVESLDKLTDMDYIGMFDQLKREEEIMLQNGVG